MALYYIQPNKWTTYVKEGNFFKEQGGLKEPWGKHWKPVDADSIEHARLIGEMEIVKHGR